MSSSNISCIASCIAFVDVAIASIAIFRRLFSVLLASSCFRGCSNSAALTVAPGSSSPFLGPRHSQSIPFQSLGTPPFSAAIIVESSAHQSLLIPSLSLMPSQLLIVGCVCGTSYSLSSYTSWWNLYKSPAQELSHPPNVVACISAFRFKLSLLLRRKYLEPLPHSLHFCQSKSKITSTSSYRCIHTYIKLVIPSCHRYPLLS